MDLRVVRALGACRWALVLFLAGCGVNPPQAPATVAPVVIDLAASGADQWHATFSAKDPFARLEFTRQSAFARGERWRVLTPGYRIVKEDKSEALVLEPGAEARREVVVEFATDTTLLYKDYEFFQRFTDGGVIVYTGHLAAVLPGASPIDQVFRFAPRAGEHVVVGGVVGDGVVEWRDATGNGTYVYLGRQTPRADAHVVAVIDPGLPDWLRQGFEAFLPKLFADYTALTGHALAARPVVYFSFQPTERKGYLSWKGGVVPGVIQLSIEQAVDTPADAERLAEFGKFLAHEAAHLWNGGMFANRSEAGSWLQEGGADAFAYRALRRLDLIDDAGLERRQLDALNECLKSLDARALDAAERQGDFAPVYPCGATLAWYSELALARAGSGDDLFALWRRVFAAATGPGNGYDESTYLDALAAAGAPRSAIAFVDDFAQREMPDRRARLRDAFAAVGMPLRDAPPPKWWRDAALRDAVSTLMAADCGGAISMSGAKGGFQLHGSARCATFKTDTTVVRIDGHALAQDGEGAHAALVAACAKGGPVQLDAGAGTSTTTVRCAAAVKPMAPWFGIAR